MLFSGLFGLVAQPASTAAPFPLAPSWHRSTVTLREAGDAGQGQAGGPIGVGAYLPGRTAPPARRHAQTRRVKGLVPIGPTLGTPMVRAAMSARWLTTASC